MKDVDQFDEILTPEEVGLLLKLTPSEVIALLEKGDIPGVKIGNVWRILKSNINGLFSPIRPCTAPTNSPMPIARSIKIGELVRNTMTEFLRENRLPAEELERLKTIEYSKEVFGLGFPFLKEFSKNQDNYKQREVKGYSRYWKNPFSERYLITSEWNERHRERFIKWSSKF